MEGPPQLTWTSPIWCMTQGSWFICSRKARSSSTVSEGAGTLQSQGGGYVTPRVTTGTGLGTWGWLGPRATEEDRDRDMGVYGVHRGWEGDTGVA